MNDDEKELTRLLAKLNEGHPDAMDEIMERVYSTLRRLADRQLRGRYGANLAGVTLEPSALVNETFLRLIKQRSRYDSSGHFFAIATQLMMRVLKDYQRKRAAIKRGGDQIQVSLNGLGADATDRPGAGISEFVAAIERLQKLDARTAEIAQLRVIWGLTMPEIAETLDRSLSTVDRDWRFARKWLGVELGRTTEGGDTPD